MIAVVKSSATPEQLAHFVTWIEHHGFKANVSKGENETIVGIIGDTSKIDPFLIESMDIIDHVAKVSEPYKKANRKFHPENSVIDCGFNVKIGAGNFQVIASVSTDDGRLVDNLAQRAHKAGAGLLTADVYNMKISPYLYKGLQQDNLTALVEAAHAAQLPAVAEILDTRDVQAFIDADIDVFQVSSKSMEDYPLLKELGKTQKPVIVKRAVSATVDDWLMAAEYVMSEGNEDVILCECGLKSSERRYHRVFDVSSIVAVHQLSHLPIICNPSKASSLARYVEPLSLAACATGADGLEIDIKADNSGDPLDETGRAVDLDSFASAMKKIAALRATLGKASE